jgi:PASTA domain
MMGEQEAGGVKRTIALALGLALAVGLGFAGGWLAHQSHTASPSGETANSRGAHQQGVLVPDLTHLDLFQAAQTLRNQNLKPGHIFAKRDPSKRGVVLSQLPPAGSRLPRGASIGLVLSAGPRPELGKDRRVIVGETCDLADPGTGCLGVPLFALLLRG